MDNMPINAEGLDEHINSLIKDSRNLMQELSNSKVKNLDVIELYADVPEYSDFDYIISMVMRWEEVSKFFEKPLRIYTYIYNVRAEKHIQKLLIDRPNICITVLPHYIRKQEKKHD